MPRFRGGVFQGRDERECVFPFAFGGFQLKEAGSGCRESFVVRGLGTYDNC